MEQTNIKPEEVEEIKKKMAAKVLEVEAQLEAAVSKTIGLEKVKGRLQLEITSLATEMDKVRIAHCYF